MISNEVLADGDHFSSLVRSERREIKKRSVVESVREPSAFIAAIAEDVDSIRVCGAGEIWVTRMFLKYWARSRLKRIRSRPSIASSLQSGRRSAARPSRSAVANLLRKASSTIPVIRRISSLVIVFPPEVVLTWSRRDTESRSAPSPIVAIAERASGSMEIFCFSEI